MVNVMTCRCVRPFVIDMHERPLDVGKRFDLGLQALADIMCLVQRGMGVHDNVHLYEIVLVYATYQLSNGIRNR